MGLHALRARWWQVLGAPALAASLVASAVSIAVAARDPRYSLFGYVALVPLFAAIRLLKPAGALACGALWGGHLYFGLVLSDAGRITSPVPGLLFVFIPALYAGVASAFTGRFGFRPLLLARLDWTRAVAAPLREYQRAADTSNRMEQPVWYVQPHLRLARRRRSRRLRQREARSRSRQLGD